MNRKNRRWGAAALTLVFCLAGAPLAYGKAFREGADPDPGERIVRVVKKIKKFFGISTLDDFPEPPRPKP
jgi:hypothetical protein